MQLHYEIREAEFVEMALLRHRSSIRWLIGLGAAVLGLVMGFLFYAYVERGLGLVLFGFSVLLLLMLLVIPRFAFARFYRRNARMFGPRTVTISDAGISSDHQLGHSESAWSVYEKFQETPRLFLLHQTADLIGIVPKRTFASPDQLEQFRALLNSRIR